MHTASSATEVWWRQFDTTDLDALAAVQPDWRLHYEQLSPGPLVARVQQLQLPGLRLVQEHTQRALRQRGRFQPHELGLALGSQHAEGAYFHGQKVGAEAIMIGRGDELDLVTPEDNLLVGVVVDTALLSSVWQALYHKPWSSWLDCKLVTPARAGQAALLRALQARVMAQVQARPAWLDDERQVLQLRDAVLIEWLEALPERVDTRGLRTAEARRALVERACTRALAQPEAPPSLLTLCRDVGASPRKLAYCFRDVLGSSPHKYLRSLRLNHVRRELKLRDPRAERVHDVAARWGFWHMGAFSAEYKRQFGELPSATRAAD